MSKGDNAKPAVTLKLDRSRYFSSVHGEAPMGLAYKQDRLPFNHQGELITELVTADLKPVVERKLKRLKDAVPEPVEQRGGAKSQDVKSDSDMNLEEWAKGNLAYTPQEVFAEIKARYGRVVNTVKEAAEFLIDEGAVNMDEVSTSLLPKA